MDFMKWLNSLDELLYEVMSWLVFYPLTLWRTLLQPIGMMKYADRQLDLPEAEQYTDALSPPRVRRSAYPFGDYRDPVPPIRTDHRWRSLPSCVVRPTARSTLTPLHSAPQSP